MVNETGITTGKTSLIPSMIPLKELAVISVDQSIVDAVAVATRELSNMATPFPIEKTQKRNVLKNLIMIIIAKATYNPPTK